MSDVGQCLHCQCYNCICDKGKTALDIMKINNALEKENKELKAKLEKAEAEIKSMWTYLGGDHGQARKNYENWKKEHP